MKAASIYEIDGVLLVSIRDDIVDTDILELQDELSDHIARADARTIVVDISEMEIVVTFVGRVLGQLTSVAQLLDAETYVVGMRPAVAMTLVQLGMYLPENRTALNLSHAMEKMRKSDRK